jgi:uncharacterized lipoprotein YddW (UPF0748 family)
VNIPRQSVLLSLVPYLVVLSVLVGCVGHPTPIPSLRKSVWVSRWEFKTKADIDEIMRKCADAGFESVMFQVRGNGTVHYASRREVWSDRFGFRAPSFDPLSHAILSARANGLQLHAWINVMPGWGGASPPTSRKQLYHAHPEWFLRDDRGQIVTEGAYSFLNPCLPDVRRYLVDLCLEVAQEYRVDGIHLDYLRFPHGSASERSPGDAFSRQLFQHQNRRKSADAEAFKAWKTGAVTELLRQIRVGMKRLPRPVLLTVAVNSNMDRIRKDVLQDWPRWARSGLVDALFPMNYTSDDALFASRSEACVRAAGRTPVVMGVGVYAHQRDNRKPHTTVSQMNAAMRAGATGVALFSYGSSLSPEWAPAIRRWNQQRR